MTNGRPLTIDETIEALGISDKTVRRMLKEGLLVEQERDTRGRILIAPDSIAHVAQQLEERRGHDEGRGNFALAAHADALSSTVDRFTAMIDERDALIRSLTEEVATLRAERRLLAPPERVRELEQRIVELEAQIAANARPMTDQGAQSTRKGWIARLFGRD
jgi:hypothetical protein